MHTQKTNKNIIPEMHLKHARHIRLPVIQPQPAMTTTTTPSTQLYDAACVAAEKANALRDKAATRRFKTAKLSAPDELYWYNNNTNWEALSRKEFRDIMIRMETTTTHFYDDYGDCVYPSRCTAIKKFWADHWGCEYCPETRQWLDLTSNTFFKSETEKKARRDLKKAEKAAKAKKAEEDELYVQSELARLEEEASAREYALAKTLKAQQQTQTQTQNQYNDAEEELYAQALAQATNSHREAYEEQQQQQQQQQQQCDYDSWYDDEEEAYEEAYEQARKEQAQKEQAQKEQAQKEQAQKEQAQKEQEEAQAYLDSLSYEDEDEDVEEPAHIACRLVFYIEELTDVKGDPDWRAYIYYDTRTRRYVLKGTRRSLLTYNKKKTVYPELKLSFRSSKQLASYLCASTDRVNVTMFAMACDTVNNATFAELYALPARGGYKTELYGYDNTRPRYSTFLNHLRTLLDVDANHSNFAAF